MGPQEEYIETVFTCEGNFYDPNLHARLEQFHRGLKDLLLTDKQKLVLKKVEPWNSVRVTFNIPREAALRLKHLAQQGHVALRELGVLAVQIEGDQLISLTIAGHNNERTELVFKTSSSHSATMPTSLFDQVQFGTSKERSGNVPTVPSTKKDVSKFISPGLADSILNSSIPASEVFRSPNVVASSCEPIPFRSNSVINTVSFSRCSTTTTTSALPPGRSPTGYPASQSQGLLSGPGTSRSPISQPGLKFPSPPNLSHASASAARAGVSPVSLPPPPPYPHLTGAVTTTTVNNVPRMCKPVTSSSPLLVNLLQTDATSVPFNNLTSSKMLPPPDASPPKRKRRQRKVKETKNSGVPLTGIGEDQSKQNMLNPALTMYNISTTMVTSSTNTLSTSAVNPSMFSVPNVTCPTTVFNPKTSNTVSVKSQIPESLLVKENILVDHRKSNIITNIQQSSIAKTGQISTALSKQSTGGGKLINPHTGHLEPVDEGSPSRSDNLQDVKPFENQLIAGELFGGMKTKLPVKNQESEIVSPKTSSPCSNSLSNKNAYICDSLGHHNNITLIKSTGCTHMQPGNSKEQTSSVGLNGQNLFAPSKPSQNVSNTAVAAFHSNYTKDLNKLFAPESKSVPNTSAPRQMSGSEMVISKTSIMSEVETGQFVTKKSISGQSCGGRKQRKTCANASKICKADRQTTTWGSDKHNVPFYKNFSDKSNPSGVSICSSGSTTSVSAIIQQNAAKASSQGKFAGVEKQDRLASNEKNSIVNQRDAVLNELNQILESPDSNKIASFSDAESENSNQSSITGSVPVVSNPFPDMNTNVKNVMSLSHDSGLGSVSEPSDDTPSESGDSEILKSTLKSNCKDDNSKLFENALYVMHEQSDGVKISTSNYTFPGSSISTIQQQQQPHQIGNSQMSPALQSSSLSAGAFSNRQVQQASSNQVPLSAGRELCTSTTTRGQLVLSSWTTTTPSSSNTVSVTAISTATSQLPPSLNINKVLVPNVSSTQNTCSSSVPQLSTSLHSYFTTSPSAISLCNATVSSVFDSRPFCAHLTTSQVTPEHLTTMASQQGSLAASTTWCNPIIPLCAKMAGGLPGGEISISKEQLKPLTTVSVTSSNSSNNSLSLSSSQGKCSLPVVSTCALTTTTTTTSSPPSPQPATSLLDQSPKQQCIGKSVTLTESLDTTQPICHRALSTLTFPTMSNDLDKVGLSQELSKLSETKSTDFSSCDSEKLNSLINTDTTATLLYPTNRSYSTWKSNATFSHLLPSDVSDHINKSIVNEEFSQRKMQVDCNNGLNGGIFLSQPGEAKEIEISVCGSIKDTSSPSVSDKCTVMEKTTVQVTVADLSNIPSGGLSAILSSNSATIDTCITSSSNSSSSSNINISSNSTCTASIAPACTINSLKSMGNSCQDLAKGSNITSIYTKRSSSTAVSTVNCLPHLYAPDLPLPKRLTESVQRLVKPIPSSDHSLPRVRKSPVSSSIRQQTASTSTSPRSSPHHGKHTSLGSPRAQTVVDHIITSSPTSSSSSSSSSSHATISSVSSSLPSSQNSWAVPSHTSTSQLSTMHNITQSLPPPQVSFVHSSIAQIPLSDQQPFPQVNTGENLVTPASMPPASAGTMVFGANRLSLSNLEPQQLSVNVADDKTTDASEPVSNSFDVPISLNTTQVQPQQFFPTDTSTPSTTAVLATVVSESQHCDFNKKFDCQIDDQMVNFITSSSASKGSISTSSTTNPNNPSPSSHTADMIHGTSVSFVDRVCSTNIAITSIEATSPTYVTAVANQVNLITATIAGQSSTLTMLTNESQQLPNSCVSQSMCLNLENAGLQSGAINSISCNNSSNNLLGGETNKNDGDDDNNESPSILVLSSDNSGKQNISPLQEEVCSSWATKPISENLSLSSATTTTTTSVVTSTPVTSPIGDAPLEVCLTEGVNSTIQNNGKRSIEISVDKSDKRLCIVVESEKPSVISPMETSCSSISLTNASDSDSAMTCLEVAAPVLGGASVQESSSVLSSRVLSEDSATIDNSMEVDTLNPTITVNNSSHPEATNVSYPDPEFLQLPDSSSSGTENQQRQHHSLDHSLRVHRTDVNKAASGLADGGVTSELKDFGATLDSSVPDSSHTASKELSNPTKSKVESQGTNTTISTPTLSTTSITTLTSENNSITSNELQKVETSTAPTIADSVTVAFNDCEQQQSLTTVATMQVEDIEQKDLLVSSEDSIVASSNTNISQAATTSVKADTNLQESDKKENIVIENCVSSSDSVNKQEAIDNNSKKPNETSTKIESLDPKEPLQETKPQPLRRGRPVADRNVSSSTRERSPVRVRNKLCDAASTSTVENKEELPNEPLKRSTRGSTRPKGFSGVRSRCPLGCEDHKSATPPRVAPPPPPPPPHTTTTTPGPGCAASKNLALPRGVDTSAPIYQIKCGTNDAVHLVTTNKD